MIISFFSHTDYTTGVDYSSNPDCLHQEDIEINLDTHIPVLIEEDGEYSIEVQEKTLPPETSEEKHARVYNSIISTESLDDIDLEWEIFSDFEIGELITARCFGGNPHAEKALTNKALAIAIALLQGGTLTPEMEEKLAYAQSKKDEVDAVRNLFNLGNL